MRKAFFTLGIAVLLLLLGASDLHARMRTAAEKEELCDRYGGNMVQKFASNPRGLVKELDELIVRVGALNRDRVNHDKSGRMLASIAEAPRSHVVRKYEKAEERSALAVRVHKKITEANRLITQTKRPSFADEDEERATGVKEACAFVIHDRATTLERMTRKGEW